MSASGGRAADLPDDSASRDAATATVAPPGGGGTVATTAASAPQPKPRRDPAIDALRGYGLIAVVLQHAVGYPAYAGNQIALALLGAAVWAVPALFATSGYLSALRPGRIDLGRRFRRLLFPYLVWSVVLFAYLNRGALASGSLPKLGVAGWLGVVFAGQAYYTLWFLAMLVYATLAGWALTTNRMRLIGVVVCVAALLGITLLRWGLPAESQQTWIGFLTFAPVCIGLYLLGAMLAARRATVRPRARRPPPSGPAQASALTSPSWSRSARHCPSRSRPSSTWAPRSQDSRCCCWCFRLPAARWRFVRSPSRARSRWESTCFTRRSSACSRA